jgi:hypothetical protein
VRRRDFQDTDHPRFYLVDQTTTEQSKSPNGEVITQSTTRSDLLAGGTSRNLAPGQPRVVEEKTEKESRAPDGTSRKVVSVKGFGVVDPRLEPSYRVVQETDRAGNVRQVFIPLD